jgi:hypothetical protein
MDIRRAENDQFYGNDFKIHSSVIIGGKLLSQDYLFPEKVSFK